MWSVGASAASAVGAGYTVLPLHLELDWDAAKAQGMPDGEGVDPMGSLTIEYVTTGGRSYDWDEIGVLEVTNRLADVGMLYPPAASVDANYVVTLPDAEIPGGVWKVTNSNGDSLFLASS